MLAQLPVGLGNHKLRRSLLTFAHLLSRFVFFSNYLLLTLWFLYLISGLTFVFSIYQYTYMRNYPEYTKSGNVIVKLQIINQRADVSFALFSGSLDQVS